MATDDVDLMGQSFFKKDAARGVGDNRGQGMEDTGMMGDNGVCPTGNGLVQELEAWVKSKKD